MRVFVSVGSNIDKERHVAAACASLRAQYGTLVESSLYESPALGFDGDDFYNMVVLFETADSLDEINAALYAIEQQQNRVREKHRFVSRTLDLDVLLYGSRIVHSGDRVLLPRAEIVEHEFVLGPLAEICGELAHPLLDVPIAELWRQWQRTHPARMQRVSKPWGEAAPAVHRQNLSGAVAGVPNQE